MYSYFLVLGRGSFPLRKTEDPSPHRSNQKLKRRERERKKGGPFSLLGAFSHTISSLFVSFSSLRVLFIYLSRLAPGHSAHSCRDVPI